MERAKVLDIRDSEQAGTKGKVVKKMMDLIREYELSYEDFIECGKIAREKMLLTRPKRYQVEKPVPSLDDVKKFMAVVEKASVKDALMIKFLLYMGIRSAELTKIEVKDLDLTPGKERLFCHRKAGRDKTFVLPEKLASLVRMYVSGLKNPVYLFESSYHKNYETRTIRWMIKKYRDIAGVGDIIHAHNFRHLLLSTLAEQGWQPWEIQQMSGHDTLTSLSRYTHRNSELVRGKANQALSQMGV